MDQKLTPREHKGSHAKFKKKKNKKKTEYGKGQQWLVLVIDIDATAIKGLFCNLPMYGCMQECVLCHRIGNKQGTCGGEALQVRI